ncbi:universal stress protein [Chryseolinea sp. Jin1]|uniref:Universal stress protein n=1 Tax=Chryseolinea lacunae TaxID=2801331 RepID=A0ABS1KSS9_9BACT|nr:universal stress protein [Chryseolinea lacunae]
MIRKIGLAIAFSPRLEALLAEAARLKKMWDAELVLIHVGDHGPDEEARLHELLEIAGLSGAGGVKVFWEKGKPGDRILSTCKKERIDLLVAGALKKENLVQYYLGTIARHILRKADCSVLLFTAPSPTPQCFKNIVVNAEDGPLVEQALGMACKVGLKDKAQWLHVVREIKMYGLTMATEQCSEDEYDALRQGMVKEEIENVEKILQRIPHEGLKVNIKLVSGKSGFELSKFAQRKHADLLVLGASQRRFSLFDRVFTHDQEYIFEDLPCNVLIVNPRKEDGRG